MTAEEHIEQKIRERALNGSLRQLSWQQGLVDFYSNDYLGFARSPELAGMIGDEVNNHNPTLNGSTGSRLLAGNTSYAQDLEKFIAKYHHAEAGLLFNSGYDANLGLLSCLPQRGDTVIHDELAHASIIDGIRLSHAKRYSFRHNDLESLEQKLQTAQGVSYIVIESVYSMDGDLAPLNGIAQLAQQYNAALIVDEAHALGVFNKGLINELQLQDKIFARVMTFGKALGVHGAVVLGSKSLQQYLINFARSFIYTTAAPFHQLAAIKMGYTLLQKSSNITDVLKANIACYQELRSANGNSNNNTSAIQTIIIGGNERTKRFAHELRNAGLDVRAILSPTVAIGSERLRICLHAYNTYDEIEQLTTTIQRLQIN